MWQSSTNGLITKQYLPSVRERQKISHLDLNFKLTQFLTGHGNFKTYLHRFKLSETNTCDCESAPENIFHILFECDMYLIRRQQFIHETNRIGYKFPPNLNDILKDKNLFIEFKMFLNRL
jgi:hypothetical protein